MTGFNTNPMALIAEELRSAGVLPSGHVSAWPRERNEELGRMFEERVRGPRKPTDVPEQPSVNISFSQLATNLVQTTAQAIAHGRISEEIRNERYETCKSCPFFVQDSKRCSECGCFMEAKTWVGGDPNMLCPKQKWSR